MTQPNNPPVVDPPVTDPPVDPPKADPPNDPPPKGDTPFPADTPLSEMTIEQQREYWKHQAKKHESNAKKHESTVKKQSDYDELKTKAAEADRLRQERETENEKAVREAAEKARVEARAEMLPQLVSARFAAAAAGRIEADRLVTLTEDIDMTRYLKDDGTVDVDKVAAKVEAWAPKPSEPRTPRPDPSQGSGRGPAPTGAEKGLAEVERRYGKQTART